MPQLYAGLDSDGVVKLFTAEGGTPCRIEGKQWREIATQAWPDWPPGAMLLVELSPDPDPEEH